MDEHSGQSETRSHAPVTAQGDRTDNFATPATDVFETSGEIVILMDVPGIGSDDVDIDLTDQTLSVTARRNECNDSGPSILSEYEQHGYFRHFRIPRSVDRGRIAATLADGVLRLVLPKTGRDVPRTIRIGTE